MPPFYHALTANALVTAFLLIGFLLVSKAKQPGNFLVATTAIAIGAMTTIVFFKIMPETIAVFGADKFAKLMFLGIASSYTLELVCHFHHCHDVHENHVHHTEEHTRQNIMFFGTFLHNTFHGVLLFAAFNVDVHAAWTLTVAIVLHAIPQNLANFLMNENKWFVVVATASGGIVGVLVAAASGDFFPPLQSHLIAFACGVLLYLALSDLLPMVNERSLHFQRLKYFLLIISGSLLVGAVDLLANGHTH